MKRPFSNIAKFYTWSCLSGINLLYPIQAVYLLSKGFSAPELALYLLTLNFLFSCIPAALIAVLLILYGRTRQSHSAL
jgi:hypothetical protein